MKQIPLTAEEMRSQRQDQAYVIERPGLRELGDTLRSLDQEWRQKAERLSEQGHMLKQHYHDTVRYAILNNTPYPPVPKL